MQRRTATIRRSTMLFAVVGATALALSACTSAPADTGNSAGNAGGDGTSNEKFVIGFQQPLGGQAWREMGLAALQALAERPEYKDKVEVKIVRTNDNDAAQQNAAIQNLIAEGVDAILFDPASATGADAAIAQAQAADIPVIANGGPYSNDYVYTVSTDWANAGTIGAEWLLEQLGDDKEVAVLEGLAGVPLNDSSMPAVEEVLTGGGASIVAQGTNGWNEADAQQAMSQILQSEPGVGGVYSFLTGGQGVPAAFADAGIPFVPVVGGSGYNGEACALVEYAPEGLVGNMIFGQPAIYAKGLEQAVLLLEGEDIEKEQFYAPLEITADNAEDFCLPDMPDNFQLGYDFPGLDLTLDEVLAFYQN
ncbi:substrate-binding domain-containing protein [Microbacterium sp. EYE_5]|uniref:substrate-binding domain-containing protein n=1 Tax=unclassified Microbacterium TaxID=2609290 RepID=UPI0020061C18|nr:MULTISPECIES: substrate-binding domain-containing protein [unclassified Microbacterium]MCK6079326.1 substrate-binding domain-containing protein [Microbacterium sp. EYE_382]MCK6084596.1 substrate-binding domain-containing protein [Microbacterium sp. EYE_384]MCK6123175.1 substrate-binding domain-containing protein [Microbacterium sp. EYE_80]MCK6125360.1 substrate-binding domain-containing protein [Microbacterium sp. EYE_79]MCK6140280.1 substrate-binding domain-containing protein [Microbacteri